MQHDTLQERATGTIWVIGPNGGAGNTGIAAQSDAGRRLLRSAEHIYVKGANRVNIKL